MADNARTVLAGKGEPRLLKKKGLKIQNHNWKTKEAELVSLLQRLVRFFALAKLF